MLKAIRRLGMRLRCEVSFAKHEWAAHRSHIAAAKSRYDIAGLETEIASTQDAVVAEVAAAFYSKMSAAASEESRALSAQRRAENDVALLLRDFKAELAPLYEELNELKIKISEAFGEKSDAYARLDSAKSSLDRWHKKSDRAFFGNKGKELPKYSIFGQDLNGRDARKRKRDSAVEDLRDAKMEIARLKERKSKIGSQIGSVKQDRSRMFELRDLGINRSSAANNLTVCRNAVSAAMLETRELQCAQSLYEIEVSERHKLGEMRTRLAEMKLDREEFLRSFASPDEKARRRNEFERHFKECRSF